MALVIRNNQSTTKQNKVLYSDFKTSFDFSNVKKDLVADFNEESVKTSIKNILLTNRGERFFNPSFGSDIRYMLFENFNPTTEQVTSELIKNPTYFELNIDNEVKVIASCMFFLLS